MQPIRYMPAGTDRQKYQLLTRVLKREEALSGEVPAAQLAGGTLLLGLQSPNKLPRSPNLPIPRLLSLLRQDSHSPPKRGPTGYRSVSY